MNLLRDFFGGHEREEDLPVSPEEGFSRVDEDLIHAAEVLKPLLKTEGYRLLESLVQHRRREIATMALEDETDRSRDWWKGYHEGANSLAVMLEHISSQSSSAEEEKGIERVASDKMPSSGGDFSI